MDNPETKATLDTGQRTKKSKNTIQKTTNIGNTDHTGGELRY